MAKLAVDTTFDALIGNIGDLELRIAELKKIANALAAERGIRPPYLEVGSVVARGESSLDASGGPVADSQD